MLQNIRIDLNSVTDQNGEAIGDHASTADHATTADSATTAESARQCIMASTAHYLQGIGLSDYVRISDNGNLIPSSSSVYCGTPIHLPEGILPVVGKQRLMAERKRIFENC